MASLARVGACSALALSSLLAQRDVHPDELALKPKIDAAIDQGVEYLIGQQQRDGSWGVHGDYVGGRTGLCLYTLLQCGVPRDHSCVQRAVAYLDSVEPVHTYSTACMILAYDALRDGREDRIEQLVDRLVGWQTSSGDWGYPQNHPDLSNTQYAALGLWVAYKRGLRIDPSHFLSLLDRMEDYRSEVVRIENPDLADGRTGAAMVDVAGFCYRPHTRQQPTGSMTAAGIAVLSICKAGLGRRLPRALRHRIEVQTEAAVRWLAQNFSVERNPNGGHHLYYLYGLERVGALMQTEQIGPHWWYVEGARNLVGSQRKGFWRDVNDTCFALLFLRRATSGKAPTTGGAATSEHMFSAGGDDARIRLRGAGQHPLSLWIDGFGDGLLKQHEQFGLRVVSVEYVDEQSNVLGKLAGDPTKVWQWEAFLHREKALPRGTHKLRARVRVLPESSPPVVNADAGDLDDVQIVESDWMTVEIRDVLAPWMETAATAFRDNLLLQAEPTVRASSELDAKNAARQLFDGSDSRRWLAAKEDENPSVLLQWRRPVRVDRVLVMPSARHETELGQFDGIDGVEVRFSGDGDEWQRLPVGRDPIAPMELQLERPRRMTAIEVRFYGRRRTKGVVGLSEIILLPPDPGRRR